MANQHRHLQRNLYSIPYRTFHRLLENKHLQVMQPLNAMSSHSHAAIPIIHLYTYCSPSKREVKGIQVQQVLSQKMQHQYQRFPCNFMVASFHVEVCTLSGASWMLVHIVISQTVSSFCLSDVVVTLDQQWSQVPQVYSQVFLVHVPIHVIQVKNAVTKPPWIIHMTKLNILPCSHQIRHVGYHLEHLS